MINARAAHPQRGARAGERRYDPAGARPLRASTSQILKRFIPTPDAIRGSRFLRWLGPRLHEPELWRLRRHAVARGIAIGVFFGFLIPIAQIPVAALLAFLLRANLWVTAVATLVTNPFTFAPMYYAAYRLGAWLLGAPAVVGEAALDPAAADGFVAWLAFWWERLNGIGRPLVVGLSVLAVGAAVVGYFATLLVWRMAVVLKRRRVLRERAAR